MRQKKKVLVFIGLIGGIFIIWLFGNIFSSGKITIIQESGNIPSVIIVKPNSYTHPTLINCPYNLARIVIDKLRKDGVNSLKSIVVTKAAKKYSGGIPYLLSQIPTQQLIFSKNIRKTKLYKKLISLCSQKNINIAYLENSHKKQALLRRVRKNKSFININANQADTMTAARGIIWYKDKSKNKFILDAANGKIGIEILKIHPGLKKLIVSINDKISDSFGIKNSNFIQIFECSIPNVSM